MKMTSRVNKNTSRGSSGCADVLGSPAAPQKGSLMKISILLMSLLVSSSSYAALNVVTSTEDLAAIAREVGGSNVDVYALAKGYQDPHFIDAKPSYLLKLRKADLLSVVGLELEVGWLPPLLTNARNAKILPGAPGFIDASQGCEILQKPTGQIDRSSGDIHPFGNPHYWLDPANGRIIAKTIADRLAQLDPAHAADYQANLKSFDGRIEVKLKEWKPLSGLKVLTYHNSLPYFAKRFGLDVRDHVEPNPGVPPSPAHVQKLISLIKKESIPLILVDPYFDERLPRKIAQETGTQMITFQTSVGGLPEIKTYFDLFDYDLGLIHKAVEGGKR
jgi:zinc/manganese transport system substrate-binding protein